MTDVAEAIGFFVSAFEFGLLNAMIGVRKMLSLIFSRENAIQVRQLRREVVLSRFKLLPCLRAISWLI